MTAENLTLVAIAIFGPSGLIFAISHALKSRSDSKAKRETADAEAHVIRTKADAELASAKAAEQLARAEVLKLEAEARVKDADNTGRMITTLGKDREQIDELIRHAKARISELERVKDDLEAMLEESKKDAAALAEGLRVERDRVLGMKSTIDALLAEIKTLRDSIDSGGAYPPGPEVCPHCGKSLLASTTIRMRITEDDTRVRRSSEEKDRNQ